MIYERSTKFLDLRDEGDDMSIERIAEALHYCETACKWPVEGIWLRPPQRIAVMRDSAVPMQEYASIKRAMVGIDEVFGVKIHELDDGLSPRERQVKATLAEMDPTREEQVQQFLDDERQSIRDQQPVTPFSQEYPLTAGDLPF